MARDDLHFRLRIPDDLKAKVAEAAAANHRSMTAEIIARLEETFHDVNNILDKEKMDEIAKAIADRIADRVDARMGNNRKD